MADIAASTVMELRSRTGLGMMECKRALTETGGDIAKAEELLRIKSGAKAVKAADRIASEGVIGLFVAADGKSGAMVEVNCETDFVAKNEDFRAFASELAQIAATRNPADLAALAGAKLASGDTVEARRVALVQKIGENLSVRRFARRAATGKLASYVHGNLKIGTLVDVSGSDPVLGKDVAMHIAAMKPTALDKNGVPADVVARERVIIEARMTERAEKENKPASIIPKMVEGGIAKFLAEQSLVTQPFVKNDKQTVGDYLNQNNATVNGFTLFVVGEGIVKRKDDFAAEVTAMATR